jgi:hypothetical protein
MLSQKENHKKRKSKKIQAIPPMYTARKGNKKKNNKQYGIQTPEKQKKRNRRVKVHLSRAYYFSSPSNS